MKTLLPTFAVTFALATSVFADDNGFILEDSYLYGGAPIIADDHCVQEKISEYLGINVDRVSNDGAGLMQAGKGDEYVIVLTKPSPDEGKKPDVAWFNIDIGKEQAAINYDGLNGPFIEATAMSRPSQKAAFKAVQRLDNLFRDCPA